MIPRVADDLARCSSTSVLSTFDVGHAREPRASPQHAQPGVRRRARASPQSDSGAGGLKARDPAADAGAQGHRARRARRCAGRAARRRRAAAQLRLAGDRHARRQLRAAGRADHGPEPDLDARSPSSDGALGADRSPDSTRPCRRARRAHRDRPGAAAAGRAGHALDPSLKLAPPIVDGDHGRGPAARGGRRAGRARAAAALAEGDLQPVPAVLAQLASAFPITKPGDRLPADPCDPDARRSRCPTARSSTGRPVWQDFVHFLPNVAGASGNFDANGPYTRVLVGAGTNSLSGGLLGTLPGLGPARRLGSPGGGSLLGARPPWVGALTASAFRPEVPCSSDAGPEPRRSAPPPATARATASAPPAPDAAGAAGARRAGYRGDSPGGKP